MFEACTTVERVDGCDLHEGLVLEDFVAWLSNIGKPGVGAQEGMKVRDVPIEGTGAGSAGSIHFTKLDLPPDTGAQREGAPKIISLSSPSQLS